MYCKKCGTSIAEGTDVCPACGYAKEEAAEEINANVQAEESATTENAFEEPSFEPEQKPSKGKKKIIIAAIACVAALAIVLTTILNFDTLKGFAIKKFGSDADYYGYVEKAAWDGVREDIVSAYGDFKDNIGTQSVSSTIGFDVGDGINNLLSLGINDELVDLVDNASIKFDMAQNNALSQLKLALSVSENPILNLDVITDLLNGNGYIGLPNIVKDYLAAKIDVATDKLIIYDEAFWDAMPDADQLDKLLDKYFDLVIDSITQVEKTEDELKVGDVTQKCTVIKFELSPELVLNTAEKVLTTLKADKDVEKIVKDVNTYLAGKDLVDSTDAYNELVKFIEKSVEAIKKEKDALAGEKAITVLTFIDGDHNIIGREVIDAEQTMMSVKKARNKDNFAVEILLADQFEVTGKGTEKGGVVNGEYSFEIDGSDMFVVTLKDFKADGITDGVASGSIKVSGTDELWGEMDLDVTVRTLLKLYDPAIELVVDNTKNASNVTINLIGQDKVLFGISFNSQKSKLPQITIPGATVDSANQDELQNWLESFDLDGLKDTFEEAGLPEGIVDSLFEMIESSVSGQASDAELEY